MLSIKPPIIAHRGASACAPENTLAAFLKAKELGINWLEFDVMLSADNQVVIIHDETLDRTTSVKGFVHEYLYDELAKLDIGSWFHPSFSSQRISLLSHAIQFLHEQDMSANIEIKPFLGNEELTVKKVLEIIKQYWTNEMTPPLISSFSIETLRAVRRHDTQCWLGLLMHEWLPDWKKICDELQCVSVHVNEEIITPEKIAAIKSAGLLTLCYTVNDVKRAQELFSWGVDAVFSDCPEKILAI